MKGVILAGGFGTRLRPLTKVINKHLLPVYNKPMIAYPVEFLREHGLKDILIVTEKGSVADFKKFLGTGSDWGVQFSYAAQEGAGGIAEALALARDFARGDSVAVVLGDNVFDGSLGEHIKDFKEGARIFLKEVVDPHRFGVPVLENGKIVEIIEKPKTPKSSYAVTGLYLFDNAVFDEIKKVTPSARNEIEITDVVNRYLAKNALEFRILDCFWSDAGTFDSMLSTGVWLAEKKSRGEA